MSAIQEWDRRVAAHHAQSLRAMGQERPQGDFWQGLAEHFRDDPFRTDDPALDRILRETTPESTVLDVGGGGGRFALPLALHTRHVTVVEPSQSMVEVLGEGARLAGVSNLSVVTEAWEEARVEPADVVLCAHVLYGVEGVEAFVRKLDRSARRRVLVLMFMESPQSHLAPFWKEVWGEERINLPGLRELLPALWEMGIFPDLEMVDTSRRPLFAADREEVRDALRRRLYVEPGSQEDRRLSRAMERLLEETEEGLAIVGVGPRRMGLLSWTPEG